MKNMKKKDDGKTFDISTPLLCLAAFPASHPIKLGLLAA